MCRWPAPGRDDASWAWLSPVCAGRRRFAMASARIAVPCRFPRRPRRPGQPPEVLAAVNVLTGRDAHRRKGAGRPREAANRARAASGKSVIGMLKVDVASYPRGRISSVSAPTLIRPAAPWVVFTARSDVWVSAEESALLERDGLVLRLDAGSCWNPPRCLVRSHASCRFPVTSATTGMPSSTAWTTGPALGTSSAMLRF